MLSAHVRSPSFPPRAELVVPVSQPSSGSELAQPLNTVIVYAAFLDRCIPRLCVVRTSSFRSLGVCVLTLRAFATLTCLYGYPTHFFFFWCTISFHVPLWFPLSRSVPWCFRSGACVAAGIHVDPRQQYGMNYSARVFYSYFCPCNFVHSVFLALLLLWVSPNNGNRLKFFRYLEGDFFILVMENGQTFIIQLLLM